MNKNFLLVMIVMLMTSVSSFAQKEYNMVITLSNGTTVTLGHNDIKEITFNDGKVSISGNMVNTIDSLAKVTSGMDEVIYGNVSNSIDSLAKVTSDIEENMVYDRKQLEACMSRIKENAVAIDYANQMISETRKESMADIDKVYNDLYNRIQSNSEAVTYNWGLIKANNDNIAAGNARIRELEDMINSLHDEISLLRKEIESK